MKIMIVHFGGFTVLGGIERVILNLENYFLKSGNIVNIVKLISLCDYDGLQKNVIEEFKQFNMIRYKSRTNQRVLKIFSRLVLGIDYTKDWKIFLDILNESYDDLPDIILVTIPYFLLDARKAIEYKKLNIKVVYWPHSSLDRSPLINSFKDKVGDILFQFTLKKAVRKADAVFAISSEFKHRIAKIDRNKPVYVVCNPTIKYEGKLIERSDSPIFIFVGRFEDSCKNISFLFKAMSKVINKNWELLMIGGGYDELKIKELAKELGINERIKWLGWKKDPYDSLNKVTAMLFTSRYEGFGMVLIEANQRGIPVISSDCKVGPSDIVIPGVNGYLYPEGDMDTFVRIVNDVIDGKLGFGTPEEIAKTAERFSEETVGSNFIKAFEELLDKNDA